MSTFIVIMTMLVAVMLSGVIVRVLPVPLPAPFVQIALGFVIAAVFQRGVLIEPHIFFLLFLPPLLFLDGWRVSKLAVLREASSILQLAVGLVILTVFGVGYLIHWMIPAVPLPVALAIAAVVSPTDPVAVKEIAGQVPIPHRMMAILEGESLFNDASGLVAFRFAVAAAVTGTFSLGQATLSFLWLALAGVVIGIGLTAVFMYAKELFSKRFGSEPGSDVLLSLITPFVVYYVAEHVNASGILAAVAAGITMSYVELSGRLPATTRVERQAVWTMVQFTLNGMMFVLLGEQLPTIISSLSLAASESGATHVYWMPIYGAVICVGLILCRWLWMILALKVAAVKASRYGQTHQEVDKRAVLAMSLAGVRGAVTLAAVMTLPFSLPNGTPFPARDLAICLAAMVILFSLLLATVGLPAVLRGMKFPVGDAAVHERTLAQEAIMQAALHSVKETSRQLTAKHPHDANLYAQVADNLTALLLRQFGRDVSEKSTHELARQRSIERQMRLEAIAASRQAVFRLARHHQISDTLAREHVMLLDMQEARILGEDPAV